MKRHTYTLMELLTVIAIIAILAGIAIPSVGYARKRARTTSCISNQGQTMKTILDAVNNQKNFLYSGIKIKNDDDDDDALPTSGIATPNGVWSRYLAEKNYIKSMDGLRCPELDYTTDGKTLTVASVAEAYGVVVSDYAGKFDFRGTKLLMVDGTPKVEVAPSVLAIGGCSTTNGKTVAATLDLGNGYGSGKPTGLHNNDTVNMFFYDGHAENFDKNTYKENKYTPKQTSATAAKAVAVDAEWKDAVK